MDNMIKFYRGLVSNLPEVGVNGGLYITTDEGAIYYGTGTGMKRLGDFIQVANVASLPEKAHESCLYYCVAENILAKWNGSAWTQINKQPTAEELKTLLGLGSLAYLSEVGETNLSSDLKVKIGTSHSHDNKDLLDTYTQTNADLVDAVSKKHSHTFVESELNKIVDGDVAKWNASEGNAKSYVDEKIAGLDYTDTAVTGEYVSAVNEVDGKISVTRVALPDYSNTYDAKGAAETAYNNAKSYADGLASNYDAAGTAAGVKSELEVEIGKKVDKVTGYSLVSDTEITKLSGVSEGANKVEGSTTNGSIKIDGVETVVYTHPDKHAISDVTGLQDALDGKQAAGDYSVNGHKHVKADITDFAHTHTASEITDLDSTIKGYDYATKTELGNVDKKFENYTTSVDQKAIDDEQDRRLGVIEGDYLKAADIVNFETKENVKKVADDLAAYVTSNDAAVADRYTKSEADGKFAVKGEDSYDDTEVRGLISGNADAIAAEVERATGIEGGLRTDINTVMGDYLKASDKTELQNQITANANAITALTDGIDPDKIDGLTDLVNWANEHAPEVESIKEDIEANAKAISDHETLAGQTYEIKSDASAKLTEAKGYTDTEVTKDRERISALESVKDDYKTADATLKSELQAEIDSDVKVVSDALDAAKTELSNSIEAAKTDASNKDAVVLSEAQKYADQAKVDAISDAEGKVNALAGNVYTKEQTYTRDEVAALIETAHTWGEF